ncbi:MAG: GNAT family N-acetyltransferase [Candidatus Omnitrophica bacterium]|nr:GNAT family N-acetyltransferase [Candidatus Omnitrophota bacterium]
MIRKCTEKDFEEMFEIINDAAKAYKGVIPEDCWREPYMDMEDLWQEVSEGVKFWGYEQNGKLVGVMGIQDVQDVTLIRHSYVRTQNRHQGIGGQLLSYLCKQTKRPVLVGTWKDAAWAIKFYEKHGFKLVSKKQKDELLRKYWAIPERQIEESVVLSEQKI